MNDKGVIKGMEKFKNLDDNKQKRIINAALKEFTEKDFEQASTNQMVKEAGIGKGMLFYYFTSKKDLYLYLIEYCIEMIEDKYFAFIDTTERDLFERLKKISNVKMEFLKEHPDSMNFMATLLVKDDVHIDGALTSRIEKLQKKGNDIIYGNLDDTLFRRDIDSKKALQLVQWTFHGYEEELKYRLRDEDITKIDYQPYFDDFFAYLDTMKTAFYTKEGDAK